MASVSNSIEDKDTTVFDTIDVDPPLEVQPEPAPGSALANIRAKRQELAAKKTLTLAVPGYDGLVLVRYNLVDEQELEKYTKRMGQGNVSELNASMDLLVTACKEILVKQDIDAEEEPIELGETTTFKTGNLHKLIGGHADSARKEVAGLFAPDGAQPFAAGQHALAIVNWLQGDEGQIDSELMGN